MILIVFGIVFGDIESDIVAFFSKDIGLDTINLSNSNLDEDNFGNGNPETVNYIRLLAWYNRYKQHKACKKKIDKELMPVAWHPKCAWNR